MTIQTVEPGDLFQDNDKRSPSPRVIRVVAVYPLARTADVTNVEHWNEKLIGRTTRIRLDRLTDGKNRQTGYTKVSR